ncbi:MAG: FAD:protein FMN transferase [Terriglobia bacterium]
MRWGRIIGGLLALFLFHVTVAAFSSPKGQFVYKKQYSMGTVYEIAAYSPSIDRASQAIDAAFKAIAALDHMMSNYDAQSDLSRLDRGAHFHAVRVPLDLFRVIQDSLVYSKESDGKYDVTVAPLVDAWKSAMRSGAIPSAVRINKLRSCVGYRKVQLIPTGWIEFHSPCLRIDLGSIAKGYAVDRAVEVLRSRNIHNALINAGGSTLYGMGAPPGRAGWSIRLRDPSGRVRPEVILRDDSVSTSEQEKQSLMDAGEFGHLIDPITGQPARSSFAVSVVAKTATATDGLSTTLYLMGPEAGAQLVRKLSDVAAIWVSPTGQTKAASTGPKILLHQSQGGNP